MGRDSVLKFDELSEPFGLSFGESFHVAMRFGATQNGNDGDEQNFLDEMVASFDVPFVVHVVDGEEKGVGYALDGFLIAIGFDDVFNKLFRFGLLSFAILPPLELKREVLALLTILG